MSEFRRAFAPGATFFFTVVTDHRQSILAQPVAVQALREAIRRVRAMYPFKIDAMVVLPDHRHSIWTLPPGDSLFSKRWSAIKRFFTLSFLANGGREAPRGLSKRRRGERGVWQRRFWEHVIRDEGDYERHMDYIHYNPVKHGFAPCPHLWEFSSFRKWVAERAYDTTWLCGCNGRTVRTPDFSMIEDRIGE